MTLARIAPLPSDIRIAPIDPTGYSGSSIRIAPFPLAVGEGSTAIESVYIVGQMLEISVVPPEVTPAARPTCPPEEVCGPRADIQMDDVPVASITCPGGDVRFKKMTRGNSVPLSAQAKLGGEEYSLLGHSMWFTGKLSKSDPDSAAVFQLTVGHGITFTNAARGMFALEIGPADTASLPALKRLLYWDCQIEDPNGKVYTLDEGTVVVTPDVTIST